MNDRPSTWMRGLIAVGVATAVNVVLLMAFRQLGVSLRTPAGFAMTETRNMTFLDVVVFSVVPALLAVLLAVFLIRRAGKGKLIFNGLVVLVSFLSLFTLTMLDNSTNDRVFQAVMHLVPAAALVALVGPTLRAD
ncbi:MAG: DUF6069 family protein [Actinomycetota bacterium]